jgi:hypothetical protein
MPPLTISLSSVLQILQAFPHQDPAAPQQIQMQYVEAKIALTFRIWGSSSSRNKYTKLHG